MRASGPWNNDGGIEVRRFMETQRYRDIARIQRRRARRDRRRALIRRWMPRWGGRT